MINFGIIFHNIKMETLPENVLSRDIFPHLTCVDLARSKLAFREIREELDDNISVRMNPPVLYDNMIDTMAERIVELFIGLCNTAACEINASMRIGEHDLYMFYKIGRAMVFAANKGIVRLSYTDKLNPIMMKPIVRDLLISELVPAQCNSIAALKRMVWAKRFFKTEIMMAFTSPCNAKYYSHFTINRRKLTLDKNQFFHSKVEDREWENTTLFPLLTEMKGYIKRFRDVIQDAPFNIEAF